jgi:DNA processing protein
MKINKLTFNDNGFPEALRHIVPKAQAIYVAGDTFDELLTRPRVAVVGSRKVSAYGKTVTTELTTKLARAGVVIVSGLAIGVDALAHRAALNAGGLTIAVLPGSLEQIYPSSHYNLAMQILEQGGALVTEYPAGTLTYPSNFIARNRIVTALSQAVLITEAAARSGTLSTARFALEQGRDVLCVPGNITSPTSAGTNNLLKVGATPIAEVDDIFHVLNIKPTEAKKVTAKGTNPGEQIILDLIQRGVRNGGELLEQSKLDVTLFNQHLTMLEITAKIRALGGDTWGLQ